MSRSLHDMLPTSRVATKDLVAMPSRSPRSRHSLLLQMAQDAETLAAQAERLTELKKLGRPTFKEIGEAIGITDRQVQRWFAGDGDVGRERLKKLADFLGTTPDYIQYGRDRREPPA